MKTTTIGIAIGTAIAALVLRSLLFLKPRQVVFIGITTVAVSLSIAAPPTVPAVITTTDRTIREVVVDASVTDPSIDSKSSHFIPSAMAGFSI